MRFARMLDDPELLEYLERALTERGPAVRIKTKTYRATAKYIVVEKRPDGWYGKSMDGTTWRIEYGTIDLARKPDAEWRWLMIGEKLPRW